MQRLKAIEVPWMVTPSGANLRLMASEEPERVEVRLVAYFWLEEDQRFRDQADLSQEALDWINATCYQSVRLTFGAGWARMSPAVGAGQVVRQSDYDWSSIHLAEDTGDTASYLVRFRAEWRRQGYCPNPSFYRVEESDWIKQVDAAKYGVTHYLVVGHDYSVEVLGTKFEWAIANEESN